LCSSHQGEKEGEGEEGQEGEAYPGEDLTEIIRARNVSEQKAVRDGAGGREGGRGGGRGGTEGGEEEVAVEVAGFGEEEEEEAEGGEGGGEEEGGRKGGGLVGGGADEVSDGEGEGVVVGTVDEELLEGHGGPGEDVDKEGLEFTLRRGGGWVRR